MRRSHRFAAVIVSTCSLISVVYPATSLLAQAKSVPRIEERNGRHALLVDGKPYLVLGAQINNSSAWPATMPQVWPALERMHANTIEAPVYWEQMEPEQGHFDFSSVDMLVTQSREHGMHLVVLWFGSWKNGNMHYAPQWIKQDTERYPRVINRAGEPIDVLSAQSRNNLEADKKPLRRLCITSQRLIEKNIQLSSFR